MINKIVFLCVNQWEEFQPAAVQGLTRNYYHHFCETALLQEDKTYYKEQVSLYGDHQNLQSEELFKSHCKKIQILYVRSNRKEIFQKVFQTADLVIVGLPYSKKECDKIFLLLLPWKDKILFLWNKQVSDKSFLKQLQREYGLPDGQLLEAEKLPSFLAEAVNC